MFVILGIGGALCVISFLLGGLASPFLTIIAGLASSLALTANLAKLQNRDQDNWPMGVQAMGLFLVYHIPIVFYPFWFAHRNLLGITILIWCALPLLYWGRSGWRNWAMCFAIGVMVCALPGGLLRWGFDYANNAQDAETMIGRLALVIVAVFMVIWGQLRFYEFLSDMGWIFVNCNVPGSLRFITRGDKLTYMFVNPDGVPRDPQLRQPPRAWLQRGNFEAIRAWKVDNDVVDGVVECVPFYMWLPGIYLKPMFAKERKLVHPFLKAPKADVDPNPESAAESHAVVDPNPHSCTLQPVADVDIRKRSETGMVSREVDQTVGCEIRVSSPSALYGAHDSTDSIDQAWDRLTSDIGRRQGQALLGYQGPISELYQDRPGFVATLLSIETPDIDGTPELEGDFERFVEVLAEVGITPAEADAVYVKSQDESDVVQQARDAITKARAEAVVGPMRAATIRQVSMAHFEAFVAAIAAVEIPETARGEAIARAATFMFTGNDSGLAQMMSSMGVMGAAFSAGRAAAAPPPAAGGGGGGGGRGGGGNPAGGGH